MKSATSQLPTLVHTSVIVASLFILGLPAFGFNISTLVPLFSKAIYSPVQFGQIPADIVSLVLVVENAKVTIKHSDLVHSVTLSASCPKHWNISQASVRQIDWIGNNSKGVSIRADATGAAAVVNGKVYQLPRGYDGSIHSLQIKDGSVTINGRPLEPLVGSSGSGNCTEDDTLEVLVPQSYTGNLIFTAYGSTMVDLDSWVNGNVTARVMDQAIFTAGRLNKLSKLVLDVQGTGKTSVELVEAKFLAASINGAGTIVVKKAYIQVSNATVSGAGQMMLTGQFGNLKKAINGTGTITVN